MRESICSFQFCDHSDLLRQRKAGMRCQADRYPEETRDHELFLPAFGSLAKGQRGKQQRSHTALPAIWDRPSVAIG